MSRTPRQWFCVKCRLLCLPVALHRLFMITMTNGKVVTSRTNQGRSTAVQRDALNRTPEPIQILREIFLSIWLFYSPEWQEFQHFSDYVATIIRCGNWSGPTQLLMAFWFIHLHKCLPTSCKLYPPQQHYCTIKKSLLRFHVPGK